MKQRSIQFSALLIIFLVSGIGSALAEPFSFPEANVTAGNMSVLINYNVTGYEPGDTVNITADFNRSVDHANISIAPGNLSNFNRSRPNLVGASNDLGVSDFLVTDAPMTPIGGNELGGNSFSFDSPIPQDLMGLFNVEISPFDAEGNPLNGGGDLSDLGGFEVDPYIDIISPDSEFANNSCVNFNFSAYDYAGYGQAGGQITYTFYLNGIAKSTGAIASGAYKQLELNLADGYYTWEVKTKDSMNTIHTSGSRSLYVDTQCPSVTLISPEDCFKEVIGPETKFNFTCGDALTAQYPSDLDLTYTLYVDGQPAGLPGDIDLEDLASEAGMDFADMLSLIYPDGKSSGVMDSGAYKVEGQTLDDGVHYWYVSVEDGAGNSVTSEVRKFYVSLDGLIVTLVSPNGVFVPSNPTFNFNVTGQVIGSDNGTDVEEGAGLPFDVKLLIDGKEVKVSSECDGDCPNCDEEENVCDECGEDENVCDCPNCDEEENGKNCVSCAEGDCTGGNCDECGFFVGERAYSVTAAVADGINKNWTVIITDSTTGKTYQPNVFGFSVDSVAPAAVANLNVEDALGSTDWTSTRDYPGLMVNWNASTDKDLVTNYPYEVYISTFEPSCIEDMQKVDTTGEETHTDGTKTPNQKLENSSVTDLCIEALDGNDLVYGKDYWVAVIARDNASNYNSAFSKCGPVRTYEDMDITLEQGWNLKSVPKSLVASNACASVFGEGSTVLYWDGSCWQFPETIEPCKGYWVYTPAARMTNVKFKGMSADGTSPDVPASLELTSGWHMIGHTSAYAQPWSTTLVSLNNLHTETADDYSFSNLITYSNGEGWGGIVPVKEESAGESLSGDSDPVPVEALQSKGYMVPGQGYWIFMKDEGTYASIENVYNPNVGQNTNNNGGFPAGFDMNDQSTWPSGFEPSDAGTWPAGFNPLNTDTWPVGFDLTDLSEFLNMMNLES